MCKEWRDKEISILEFYKCINELILKYKGKIEALTELKKLIEDSYPIFTREDIPTWKKS